MNGELGSLVNQFNKISHIPRNFRFSQQDSSSSGSSTDPDLVNQDLKFAVDNSINIYDTSTDKELKRKEGLCH